MSRETQIPETRDQRSTGRKILFFTCALHALTHVSMIIFSTVIEPMRLDFGLSTKELTAFVTLSTTLLGLGALPAGWLADRWGEKPLLVAGFFLLAAGVTLLGLARSTFELGAGMVCLGLGASIFHPVGNSLLARGERNQARAMGINGFWGSLGEAVGPIFGAQVALFLSWRWSYFGLALPLVVFGTWLALSRIDGRPARSPGDSPPPEPGSLPALFTFLFIAMTLGGLQFWIVKTMLPTHVERHTSSALLPDTLRGGYLTGLAYAIGGIGQYAAGILAERKNWRLLYPAIFLAATPLLYLAGKIEEAPLVATACLISALIFSVQPVENSLLGRISPERWKGAIFGLKFVLTFGVGGTGAFVSGWVESRHGTSGVFNVAALCTALAFIFALGACRRGGSAHPTR